MRELALFAGIGGGILGGKLLGWRTICAVEINPYCQRVLMQRQDDGILDPFPIWGDIRTFRGGPWRGLVDVISGGFPCTDISIAGRGAGITGEHSGLWSHMARVIREVRPNHIIVENSPALVDRGLGVVLGDMASMGYDAEWGVFGAVNAGAPHLRYRLWIVANTNRSIQGHECCRLGEEGEAQRKMRLADVSGGRPYGRERNRPVPSQRATAWTGDALQAADWKTESGLARLVNGVPHRVERTTAIGNAQVPAVEKLAFLSLGGPITP